MRRKKTITDWTSLPAHVFILALLIASTGCGAINHELQQRVAAEAAGLEPRVQDDSAVREIALRTSENRLALPASTELSEHAGLEDYVRIALRDNPAIRKAIRDVQVLGYRVPQVTSLDDPMVSFIPPTGDMVQTIPFPGKLTAKGRIVEQAVRMAFDKLADVRISTVSQVKKAYYDYYLADISIAITRDSQALLRQIRDVAAARYRAGLATQQDVLRAEVELYNLTNELITLEQRKSTATALLNSLMNRNVESSLPPPAPFDLARIDWKMPQLMAEAVEKSPKLARLRNQILRDLEAVKLARLDYFPDITAPPTRSSPPPVSARSRAATMRGISAWESTSRSGGKSSERKYSRATPRYWRRSRSTAPCAT